MKKNMITVASLAVSTIALVWLFRSFDLGDVVDALGRADSTALLPLLILVPLSFALRAQRWRLALEHEPPPGYRTSFSALMIGYLLNNVLPARAGDVARALELGRTERLSRVKVFASLVVERTADLAFLLVLLSLVLLSYPALPPWMKQAGSLVTVVTVGALGTILGLHLARERLLPLLGRIVFRRLPPAVGLRAETILVSGLDGIAGVFRPRRALGFLTLTVVIWAIEVLIVFVTARAVGLDLAPGNALFVLLAIAIGTMVPSSPGFVGTYEFFGVAALGLIGIGGSAALACILLQHLVALAGSSLIGLVCLALRPASGRGRASADPSPAPARPHPLVGLGLVAWMGIVVVTFALVTVPMEGPLSARLPDGIVQLRNAVLSVFTARSAYS